MTPLTFEHILSDIQYNWYEDQYPLGTDNIISPSTMIYFTDKAGNTNVYPSSGQLDPLETDNRQSYVEDNLMRNAALYLANAQCVGDITNIKPKSYQVYPIYYK